MVELQKHLMAFARVLTLALASIFVWAGSVAHAQFIPDRCPEPCEIGGSHVSEDYQRLTTPFYIRNDTTGNYLMVDEYSVSSKPLIRNDERYLWVLLPGPDLYNEKRETSEIIDGNGFEKKLYKLINLKFSRALMTSKFFNLPIAKATHLGDKQFWLFRKDPNDKTNTKYLLYNPEVQISEYFSYTHLFNNAEISPSMASKETMPALMQSPGSGLSVRTGADFGASGFTWKFEESTKPKDLARLTIKSVTAIQVSTGRSADTDKLVDGIKYAVEYGPMLVQPAAAAAKSAKAASQKITKKLAERAARKAAEKAAKEAAEKGVKRSFKETLKAGAKAAKDKTGNMADALITKARALLTKNPSVKVSEDVVKESLRRRLVKGTYIVGSKSYRGLSWVAKKTGSAATKGGKTVVKLGRTASRKTNEVAKKGYDKLKKLGKEGAEKAVRLVEEKKKELVEFVNDPKKMDDYLAKKMVSTTLKRYKKVAVPVLREFLKPSDPPDKIYANNFENLSLETLAQKLQIPQDYKKEILAVPRTATFEDANDISAEEYLYCSDTKTYAVPEKNPPYYRIGSSQNLEAMSQGAKTLFETFTSGEATDEDAAKAAGMTALNLALDPAGTIINDLLIGEILRATDNVDDDLQIRINNRSVWPNGGGDDHRKIGSGHKALNVGVEYLFRRGDDITINLIEWDKGGAFSSGDDSLGDLTIPTHNLLDIEEYEGAYIQNSSEGSLYKIDFVIEPLYAPTPIERVRKKIHDVECASVLAQGRAEEFAEEVETVRIEGRSAMVREFDNGARKTDAKAHLRAFEHTVAWANEQSCPISNNYAKILNGEWRVGRFNEFGEKDRSVTWTNTFNDSDLLGGDIVTPSQNGKWRTNSLSQSKHVTKNTPTEYEMQTRNGLEKGTQWDMKYLGIEERFTDMKYTEDTCEIYTAMYNREGVLGGIGSSSKSVVVRSGENNITVYDAIGSETAIALRGDLLGSKFDGTLYQIADEKSITNQAVNFLADYYEYMPRKKAGVDANLHLASSGSAEFWYEKLNLEEDTRSGPNSEEAQTIKDKIKASITGSWEVGPYSQNEVAAQSPLLSQTSLIENQKYLKKADAKEKVVWTFTDDGIFIEKSENDFWFRPIIHGTWRYIGDQRIEVRTNIPVKIPDNAKPMADDKFGARVNIGPNAGLDLNTGRSGDNTGLRFIVKMAQKPHDPTEFTGFYVQDSSGKKAIWSQHYYRGISPYDVAEQYSDAFLDLLERKSSSYEIPAAYRVKKNAKKEADKAGMAAKLAELEALKEQSVCNMESYTALNGGVKRPGDSAFSGKWRVGEYNARGEKKYGWNYIKTSPYASQSQPPFISREDITDADDPAIGFYWLTGYLNYGEYEQEWTFPDNSYEGSVTVKSRLGNGRLGAKFLKGDVAPKSALPFNVEYDKDQKNHVMKSESEYLPIYTEENFDLSWFGEGCNGGTITLGNFDQSQEPSKYPVNFIYHPNGDREFYIINGDGVLFLWGLQEADKTKYTYKYGIQQRTVGQIAEECPILTRRVSHSSNSLYEFVDYRDENMGLDGGVSLKYNGLTPLNIFMTDERSGKFYFRGELDPGDYTFIESNSDQKIVILHPEKEYNVFNYADACVGTIEADGQGTEYIKFGEGFIPPPATHTSALDAMVSCQATYIKPNFSLGQPAVVKFKNNTAKPLEIFRLDEEGRLISPSGRKASKAPFETDLVYDYFKYLGLNAIATVKPGDTHTLKTMVGHGFTAITRGTTDYVSEYNAERGRNIVQKIGEAEQCYARHIVSDALETIELRDDVPQDQIDEEYFKFSTPRRKEIAEYNARNKKLIQQRKTEGEAQRVANNLGLVLDVDPAKNTVSESVSVGTTVGLTAVAIDGDRTDTVSYAVISKNSWLEVNGKLVLASYFDVKPNTGEVFVKHPLDFEVKKSHRVSVIATSSDGSTSIGEFLVNIEDENEFDINQAVFSLEDLRWNENRDEYISLEDQFKISNNRYFTSDDLRLNELKSGIKSNNRELTAIKMNENAPVGKHVVWFIATDNDSLDSVRYSLSDDAGGLFNIDPLTGRVTLSNIIDYESGSFYPITAVATSSDGSSSSATMTVEILNVNEGPVGEILDVNSAPNQVKESAPVGTEIGVTVGALEIDSRTDKVTLKVEPSCDDCPTYYEINSDNKIITASTFTVDLEDMSSESYEQRINSIERIRLKAESSDGSSSTKTIRVDILDDNEFEIGQAWDVDRANNTVAEDAPIGTPVGITAQARDFDVSASVRYWLSENAGGMFKIDIDTGVVTVNRHLNYSKFVTNPSITVLSESSDRSRSLTTFNIRITDVDKYEISQIIDDDRSPNTVWERTEDIKLTDGNSYTGITVQATDEDADSVIRYSLKGSGYEFNRNSQSGDRSTFDGISIDVVDGRVYAWNSDSETAQVLNFEVIATSGDASGNGYTTSEEEFYVKVKNLNDNPVWPSEDVDTDPNRVSEHAAFATPVGITAVAKDADVGATITYELGAGSYRGFLIDPETGVVVVGRTPPDAEFSNGKAWINVVARSSDGSVSENEFEIEVTDVNTEHYVEWYDTSETSSSIREDAEVGEVVPIELFAFDRDVSDSISYSFRSQNNPNIPFVIDAKTGIVTVGRSLREPFFDSYDLSVLATSTDGTVDTLKVVIRVEGINEFSVSDLSDIDPATNEVDENARRGTPVGIAAFATDDDSADTITYKLTKFDLPFSIDRNSGIISVSNDLDYEKTASYSLNVLATSSDGSTSNNNFVVDINDINEHDLSFIVDSDQAGDVFDENSAWGTAVGITAFARDIDGTAVVTYQLVDDADGRFFIDEITGIVTVEQELDFEADSAQFSIEIIANSSDGSASNSSRKLIYLKDVNEFDISWIDDVDDAENEVNELAKVGDTIGITAFAKDEDRSRNFVTYAIVDSNDQEITANDTAFQIGRRTGVVSVSNPPKLIGQEDPFIRVRATSADGSKSIEEFPITILRAAKWYENPQGPRMAGDYPAISEADQNLCIAADDNVNNPDTYNNENAFYDCIEAALNEASKWYSNPQGPRKDTDYPDISDEDHNKCVLDDQNINSVNFNNENAFFDCLERHNPKFVNWYDNPRWPNILDELTHLTSSQIDACYAANENKAFEAAFNNEEEFVYCLRSYPVQQAPETTAPANDVASNPVQQPVAPVKNDASLCARQYGLEPEYSDRTGVMKFVNSSQDYVEVHQINADGTSSVLLYLENGQTTEVDMSRRLVHVGFDPKGNCIGAGKMRESKGRITFGE